MPELFNQGTLHMSTSPIARSASDLMWSEVTVNRIAMVAALVLMVVALRDIILIFPALLRCIPFWKGNKDVEHSVSFSRTRNSVALVCGIMFCIVADRYQLIDPSWRAAVPRQAGLALTAAVLAGFVLLREFFYMLSPLRSRSAEYSCTVRNAFYNYFILFALAAFASVLLMEAFRLPQTTVKVVLLIEAGIFYLLDISRTAQIFSSRYGLFPTILYLCALELLPTGILIFTCTR